MTTTLTHRTDTEHQALARAASDLGVHVEIPENVRSAQQVHAALMAEDSDGGIELIATLTSGRVYANVERFDYTNPDGTADPSGLEVSIFLPDGNRDAIGEGKVGFSSDDAGRITILRDVARITEAAAKFVDAYVAASSAKIEVR
ncbi:hypothetical protein [Gordonia sp. UCD-TK1]|uniref:hypothetical protein n=1 Tax=Gordonia sp. UCD-TK1 TaxID=1857893 RepID=UPI00080DF84A|nr:hypothetical protein [Gordonia sp. UCD-TK1]OCH81026.1 hypothetical protein A9310_19905 [Gordonia sp. UCD-TK1]